MDARPLFLPPRTVPRHRAAHRPRQGSQTVSDTVCGTVSQQVSQTVSDTVCGTVSQQVSQTVSDTVCGTVSQTVSGTVKISGHGAILGLHCRCNCCH
jgi:hypothetical protein